MTTRQNFRILRALLKKELLQLKRNPFIPRLILAMPIMVMLIAPLVANLDVKNLNLVVVDSDRSQLSRLVTSNLDATIEVHVIDVVTTLPQGMTHIEDRTADALLAMPPGFAREVGRGEMPNIFLAANGVNATKSGLGTQYVAGSVGQTLASQRPDSPFTSPSVQYRFNETLNYRIFMIPALMVMLLILICGFLPALNIVTEKQNGTMDAINVSPVSRLTFTLSKLLIYWAIGLLIIFLSIGVAFIVYDLSPKGGIGVVLLATLLFSLVMSGIGVAIANRSESILQAIFVMFACIMIFQLMSGLFTPLASMPQWAQWIAAFIPPRYFVEIMRAVYLKGAGIADLSWQFSALGALALLSLVLAVVTYSKRS